MIQTFFKEVGEKFYSSSVEAIECYGKIFLPCLVPSYVKHFSSSLKR